MKDSCSAQQMQIRKYFQKNKSFLSSYFHFQMNEAQSFSPICGDVNENVQLTCYADDLMSTWLCHMKDFLTWGKHSLSIYIVFHMRHRMKFRRKQSAQRHPFRW